MTYAVYFLAFRARTTNLTNFMAIQIYNSLFRNQRPQQNSCDSQNFMHWYQHLRGSRFFLLALHSLFSKCIQEQEKLNSAQIRLNTGRFLQV